MKNGPRDPSNDSPKAAKSGTPSVSLPPPGPNSHHDDLKPFDREAILQSEYFLESLMRRQFKLSLSCAATFLVALLGLPLVNYFFPETMATRVAGFTLTWLLLGVLFFPLVWIIAAVFIKRSIALEEEEAARLAAGPPKKRSDEFMQWGDPYR